MSIVYFPGANTPRGFFNRFSAVMADPRVRRRIYLKGGPGCGKSTLMRRLAKTAADLEADCELGLCSSDPDSLDTLLIEQAGLAVCDATPPHAAEPPLCGSDGVYLDLGRFYDAAALAPMREELGQLQAENQACYRRVRQALRAVQALYRLREELVDQGAAVDRLTAAAGMLLTPLLRGGRGQGMLRELFFTGVTPSGCISRYGMFQSAATIYLLLDSCHLSGRYLQEIARLALDAGQNVIAGYSPLDPDGGPAQLYLPQLATAFVRQSSHFACDLVGTTPLDLDALVQISPAASRQAGYLRQMMTRLLAEAVPELQEAKALHDAIERRMHPHVDFEGVTAASEACCRQLEQWLTHPMA